MTGTIWFFTLGLLGIGWIVDLFLIPSMDRKADLKFEQGPIDWIFQAPSHPYTRALLDDVPSVDPDQRMLERVSLEADSFSVRWGGTGCRFAPRCPARQVAACTTLEPRLGALAESEHRVACHLAHPLLAEESV